MFEDSLIESEGRIRTKSKWFAISSFIAQAALLLLLVLYPLVHPQALPKQSMERLLIAPPPPRAPAHIEAHRVAATTAPQREMPSLQDQLRAPGTIPRQIAAIGDAGPAPTGPTGLSGGGNTDGILNGINLGSTPPVVVVASPAVPKHPVSISSGVAAGQLLRPIQPYYPAVAKATRIQGTVVIEATISRAGTVENLVVTDGPPMLRQAAIDAVSVAHYRPFLLNGEAVEVQTSIRVIFSLGG